MRSPHADHESTKPQILNPNGFFSVYQIVLGTKTKFGDAQVLFFTVVVRFDNPSKLGAAREQEV